MCLRDDHIFSYLKSFHIITYGETLLPPITPSVTHVLDVTYSHIQPFIPLISRIICDHFPTTLEHLRRRALRFPPKTSPNTEFHRPSSVLLRSTRNFAPHLSRPYTT